MTSKQAESVKTMMLRQSDSNNMYLVTDIGTDRLWDYSLPTLTKPSRFTERQNFASNHSFFEVLRTEVNGGVPYEILNRVGALKTNNDVVLFGGSLLDIILKREGTINDFDLRLVGEEFVDNETKCLQKAKDFVSTVFDFLKEENEKIERSKKYRHNGPHRGTYIPVKINDVTVSRRRSTVTINIPGYGCVKAMCFQLTFSPSKDLASMLSKCYPHCTRVAIKDSRVVLDEMAKYCIQSTCVVLSPQSFVDHYIDTVKVDDESDNGDDDAEVAHGGRTLSTQIVRYTKYFTEKGFDIILPELDISKVPTRNLKYGVAEVLALPGVVVVYDKVVGNKIMTSRMVLPEKVETGDGLVGNYDSKPELDVGESIHYNIRCLVHDVYDSFKFVAKGEVYGHVFDFVPSLTPRMIGKSYETVASYLSSGSIPLNKVTGYFSASPPEEVINKLVIQAVTVNRKKGKLPGRFRLDEDDLNELIDKEVASLLVKIDSLRGEMETRGLDRLVIPYPENVSSKQDLEEAFYGEYKAEDDSVVVVDDYESESD